MLAESDILTNREQVEIGEAKHHEIQMADSLEAPFTSKHYHNRSRSNTSVNSLLAEEANKAVAVEAGEAGDDYLCKEVVPVSNIQALQV